MSAIYVCDGCGKQEIGLSMPHGTFKPPHWYSRADADGQQHACSRQCITIVAEKTGKTNLVRPV